MHIKKVALCGVQLFLFISVSSGLLSKFLNLLQLVFHVQVVITL